MGSLERLLEGGPPIDGVDVVLLLAHLVADARVDEHRLAARADDERTHPEPDPVPRIGGRATLPERLRHHAKHRAAIEREESVGQRQELELTENHADCFNSMSRPRVLDGCTKAMREPWAPALGVSSMRRTPFPLRAASAASMSGTRRQK